MGNSPTASLDKPANALYCITLPQPVMLDDEQPLYDFFHRVGCTMRRGGVTALQNDQGCFGNTFDLSCSLTYGPQDILVCPHRTIKLVHRDEPALSHSDSRTLVSHGDHRLFCEGCGCTLQRDAIEGWEQYRINTEFDLCPYFITATLDALLQTYGLRFESCYYREEDVCFPAKQNIISVGNFNGRDIHNTPVDIQFMGQGIEIDTCGAFPTPGPSSSPSLEPSLSPSQVPSTLTDSPSAVPSGPPVSSTPAPSSDKCGDGKGKGGGNNLATPTPSLVSKGQSKGFFGRGNSPATPTPKGQGKGSEGKGANNPSTYSPSGSKGKGATNPSTFSPSGSKGKGSLRTLAQGNASAYRDFTDSTRNLQDTCSDDFFELKASDFVETPFADLSLPERIEETIEFVCEDYPTIDLPGTISKEDLRRRIAPRSSIDEDLYDGVFSRFDMNGNGNVTLAEGRMFCDSLV